MISHSILKRCNVVIVVLFFLLVNATGQNVMHQSTDSISYYSGQLTGEWKLVGYYEDGKFVDRVYSTSYIDSIQHKKQMILTDKGFVVKTYMHDSLISIEKSNEYRVVALSFRDSGLGSYDEYSKFVNNPDDMTIESCQPFPEIVKKKDEYFINLTYMSGDVDLRFKVSKDTLYLISDDYTEKYLKITPCNNGS